MTSLNDILKSILSSGNALSKEMADKHRTDMDYAPRAESIPASIARPLEMNQELNDTIMKGVGDPNNLPSPMQNAVVTQADGSNIPMALSRSMTPIADAYPALNEAIMAGIPKKSEEPFNMVEDARKNPIKYEADKPKAEQPKLAASSPVSKKQVPEEIADADSTDSTESTPAKVEEKKRTFDTEEQRIKDLAEKYMVARRNASMYAGNMQSNDTLAFMTGRPAGNEGLALKYKNELGKAEDAKIVLDERRLEQKHSLDIEKAVGQLDDEKAARDANSDISTSARDILKAMSAESGIKLNIPDNMPYSHLKEMFKPLETFMQARANQETRKEAAATRALTMQMANEEKKEKQVNDKFTKMNEKLQSELVRTNTTFGKNAAIYRSAQAIEALTERIDPNNLDNRQIMEIARNLDAMLTQGAGSITGTNKLIPHTASGDVAKIAEYITGLPKGAKQGEFVKRTMETIEREKALAKKNILNSQNKILAGYEDLKKANPDRYTQILERNDIPTGEEKTTATNPTQTASNKIKVSNGKETLMIDPADLEHAKADGYKKVD